MKLLSMLTDKITHDAKTGKPTDRILFEIENSNTAMEYDSIEVENDWKRYEYVFQNNVRLYFEIKSHKGFTKLFYKDVKKLVVLEYQDIFIEVRINTMKQQEDIKFYIMNDDVDRFNFEIGKGGRG